MIVMVSNNTGFDAGRLAGKYPGQIGHLHSVDSPREPKQGIPWALDNGVFGAWQTGREWSEEPLYKYLDAYAAWDPSWVICPDWVGDRDETLRRWEKHSAALLAFGIPMAFAVQDGMTTEDVPSEAAVIFVGGTTSWKWQNLRTWTDHYPRVHVGRVNSRRLLNQAASAGAESCDGTGWFRDPVRTRELDLWLEESKTITREPWLNFSQ